MEQKKLSFGTKVGFGIGDIGGNAVFTIMAFVIQPFLILTLGLEPVLAGVAIWLAKIWDAFTDPFMGTLSDRTRTRLGRRRPYLLIGGIFALVSMGIMFFNPHFDKTQQTEIFIWAIFAYCLLCTAYTVFNVPYSALTPDLSDDFHEQTSLNSYRMFFAVIGTFIAAGAFQLLVDLFAPGNNVDKSNGYFITGLIYGALIMAVTLITFFSVREKKTFAVRKVPFAEVLRSYLRVFRNKPYRIILFAYAINLVGITLVSSTMILFFRYIFNAEGMASIAMLCLLGVAMGFIVFWNLLKKRIEKNVTYAIGLFIIAGIALLTFIISPVLDMGLMFVLMAVAGTGMAATYVAPWAMIPDTIEYDQKTSGLRDEGVYYGLWTLFSKTGQAMAGLISGIILQLCNFVPPSLVADAAGHIDTQVPEAIFGIRLILGPVAAFFLVLSGIIVLFYPLNEKKYREIMAGEGKKD